MKRGQEGNDVLGSSTRVSREAVPFATCDPAVTWTATGGTQFAQAMADQLVASTAADLDALVRPELMGKPARSSKRGTPSTTPMAGCRP